MRILSKLSTCGFFVSVFSASLSVALVAPAAAGVRTVPIDLPNHFESIGDAGNGDTIALPAVVDYGTGPQSSVVVSLGACCGTLNGFDTVPVALQFTNGDSLYANLIFEGGTEAAVFLSDPPQVSLPGAPLTAASTFNFVDMESFAFAADVLNANVVNGNTYGYGASTGNATFQFRPLAGGGGGSFELLLACDGICLNIGFNLGGLSFSSDTFDPSNAPSQLYSFTDTTFDFRFLNTSSVPEPGTWAMMLMGFGFVGAALRRNRMSRLSVI
jgi:hypothetical protein